MTIENSKAIDFVGIDKTSGEAVLTISDHLDWTDEGEHLLTLQAKINSYLEFIETGQLARAYPAAVGRPVVIEVVGKFDLPEGASTFYRTVQGVLRATRVGLRFLHMPKPS